MQSPKSIATYKTCQLLEAEANGKCLKLPVLRRTGTTSLDSPLPGRLGVFFIIPNQFMAWRDS